MELNTADGQSSNRTFMELKYCQWQEVEALVCSSNRTFMELKYVIADMMMLRQTCSNRTFMELKYHPTMSVYSDSSRVLIVPLWN